MNVDVDEETRSTLEEMACELGFEDAAAIVRELAVAWRDAGRVPSSPEAIAEAIERLKGHVAQAVVDGEAESEAARFMRDVLTP